MVLILLLSLLLPLSFAQTHPEDCQEESHKHGFIDQFLEWSSATKQQIQNAKCQNAGKITDKEMLDYLNRKSSYTKVSKNINGVNLKDESPELIALFDKLTTFDPLFNFELEVKKNSFVVPEGCDKVMCALETILGKDIALKSLYMLDRYELNISHVTDEDLSAWRASELDIILEAVDDLPSHLLPYEKNEDLKHFKRSDGENEINLANAVIRVFSAWGTLDSDQERMATIVHEIGHNIGNRLKQDQSQAWLDMSGWVEKDGKWTSHKEDKLASKYGATNPDEDFAETFVAYRYNPESLKKNSPEKYQHMKENVFLGIEYTSEEKCKDSNSYYAKLKSEINIKDSPVPDIFSGCIDEINQILYQEEVDLKKCIKKGKMASELEKKIQGLSELQQDAIISAANLDEANADDISDKEELEAYKKLVGEMYGAIADRFDNYSGDCSNIQQYGAQNLKAFNQRHLKDDFNLTLDDKKVNDHLFHICKELKSPQKVTCKDLLPYMRKHLPKRLYTEPGEPAETATSTAVAQPEVPRAGLACEIP